MRKTAIAGVAVIVCCAIYSLAQDKVRRLEEA